MNVLAIGAHFDDIELGCSASIRKHVLNGDNVIIYVATKSGYVSPGNVTVRNSDTARKEGEEAAKIIGAKLLCGEFETLNLEFNDELDSALVDIIEKESIQLIYTHYRHDVHHDHAALAKASLHAGRHVNRILTYRSNFYQSDVPFVPNFYVDITDTWDTKEAVIRAHESEFSRAGKSWLEFFKNDAINNGLICGVKMAESFNCVKYLI